MIASIFALSLASPVGAESKSAYGQSSIGDGGYVVTRATDNFWFDVGWFTSTGYISGNSRTYVTTSNSVGTSVVTHSDEWRCSAAGVTSVGISKSGPSIGGGIKSKFAEWETTNNYDANRREFKSNYHFYQDSGKFSCKVTNVPALAKTTHSMGGTVKKWNNWYSSAASWSKWW